MNMYPPTLWILDYSLYLSTRLLTTYTFTSQLTVLRSIVVRMMLLEMCCYCYMYVLPLSTTPHQTGYLNSTFIQHTRFYLCPFLVLCIYFYIRLVCIWCALRWHCRWMENAWLGYCLLVNIHQSHSSGIYLYLYLFPGYRTLSARDRQWFPLLVMVMCLCLY